MLSAANLKTQQPMKASVDMLWSWVKFVDHDLDLTVEGEEAAPFTVPMGDPDFDQLGTGEATVGFHRSNHTDIGGERAYGNEITSYLDASMVYGSSEDQHAAILGGGGKMLLDDDGLLPKDSAGQYMGGDVRSGENVGLTSLHTVFAPEHNRIVDELAERDPGLSDEALYTLARRIVETEIQKITYDEFLPKILGEGALDEYAGFDADVNPTVSVEFSTAAFRFGHTLLSPTIQRLAENGGDAADALELREAFFASTVFAETGVDLILRGLADGKSQAYDPMLVEDVRSFLFGQPGAGGFDLASLNIQRGRDHGLQSYNDMREALGLDRKVSFAEISSNPDIAARLEEACGDVDMIDAWVGGLAEDSFGDGLVGELFHLIIADQFDRVRAGDKY
jgi:peroxidase